MCDLLAVLNKQKKVIEYIYSPTYCIQNLVTPNKCNIPTTEADNAEIATGPTNVRGTTPGNSLWSY